MINIVTHRLHESERSETLVYIVRSLPSILREICFGNLADAVVVNDSIPTMRFDIYIFFLWTMAMVGREIFYLQREREREKTSYPPLIKRS